MMSVCVKNQMNNLISNLNCNRVRDESETKALNSWINKINANNLIIKKADKGNSSIHFNEGTLFALRLSILKLTNS